MAKKDQADALPARSAPSAYSPMTATPSTSDPTQVPPSIPSTSDPTQVPTADIGNTPITAVPQAERALTAPPPAVVANDPSYFDQPQPRVEGGGDFWARAGQKTVPQPDDGMDLWRKTHQSMYGQPILPMNDPRRRVAGALDGRHYESR